MLNRTAALVLGIACAACRSSAQRAVDAPSTIEVAANRVCEWSLASEKAYADPFNEVEMDALVTAPDGGVRRIPAFWAGGQTWRVRYASGAIGLHRWRTICSDASNPSLHDVEGTLTVLPYDGQNPLYRHGPVRVAADKRHFEHADGTPFFWLADTWWMGLCRRLAWPDEFQALTADRIGKGFTVVQIVAGLYPDMPAFDERGANEAGFPWELEYARINPAYFDAADRRIAALADAGLAPCIVAAWGYHLPWLGLERMKKHWRNLVARYGAYPVFWCVAGEGAMPYYLAQNKQVDAAFQKKGWTEVAAYLRSIDPYDRPVSIHPTTHSRSQVEDVGVLDFEMLQTGHGDRGSIPQTITLVRASRTAAPPLPTINSEVCYEGILGTCHEEIQRFMAWSCLLSGAAGHTYGANGIWQMNRRGEPFGKSPHGGTYGPTPWDEAARLPGSAQVGLARQLLERLPWWEFEPHPEWASFTARAGTFSWGRWIWFPEGEPARDAPAGARFFRRVFDLPAAPRGAILRLAADNSLVAHLNGRRVAAQNGWTHYGESDVAAHLKPGPNVLAIRAENAPAPSGPNPAGVLCHLEIDLPGQGAIEVRSDADWRASDREEGGWTVEGFRDQDWPAAAAVAQVGDGPWGTPDGAEAFQVPYAAGVPGRVRVIYIPSARPASVHGIEPGVRYRARYFNPVNGETSEAGAAEGDANGSWNVPKPPVGPPDRVLVLEKP